MVEITYSAYSIYSCPTRELGILKQYYLRCEHMLVREREREREREAAALNFELNKPVASREKLL